MFCFQGSGSDAVFECSSTGLPVLFRYKKHRRKKVCVYIYIYIYICVCVLFCLYLIIMQYKRISVCIYRSAVCLDYLYISLISKVSIQALIKIKISYPVFQHKQTLLICITFFLPCISI